MLRTLTIGNAVLMMILLPVFAASGRAQQRKPSFEPMLIKLYQDKKAEQDRSAATELVAERDYADKLAAKRGAATPEAAEEANQQLTRAGTALDQATRDSQDKADEVREVEQQASNEGITFTSSAVKDAPPILDRPHHPMGIKLGIHLNDEHSPLEVLKRMANNPSSVPGNVDGNTREDAGTPKPTLVTTLSTAAEIQERIRNNQVAEEQQTAQQKAFQEELDKNIALARQEAKTDFDVVTLIKQINAHVDAAGNVDPNNDEQIREYNAKADRLYYRYKQLTGKDLGYKYQRIR